MELGCDGVLMNTAIAEAKDPIRMARAMKLAVEAGRHAYLAGRMGDAQICRSFQPAGGSDLTRAGCKTTVAARSDCGPVCLYRDCRGASLGPA